MQNLLQNIKDIFSQTIWWNTVWRIFLAIAVFLVLAIVIWIIMKIVKKRYNNLVESKSDKRREIMILGLIWKCPKWILIILEIYIVLQFVTLSPKAEMIVHTVFLFVLTIVLIKICIKCLNFSMDKVFRKDKTARHTIEIIIKVLVWALWIFMFLTNIWINLTPIIAGFWVAWIAVAFALQNILTDLFSSFSILFSKPFIVGDLIKIWEWDTEKTWVVKEISLKSTTLSTVQWQEIIIPNSMILSKEIINYRTMKSRRQRISIWVTYDTWSKNLKLIPSVVEKVISATKWVEYERCYLEKLESSSINFLISYVIINPDYKESLIINEKIYLDLIEAFEKEGIEFAFPSQTIYMKK